MFCHKCGTQNPDDAGFCIKCGAKLITEDSQQAVPAPVTPQQSQATPASQQPIQPAPPQQPVPPVVPGTVPTAPAMPPKKKSRKKFIVLGIVLLVVIIGIFIAVNWEGETDYIATVKAHMPFNKSQGLPYSYEEVFGKYLSNAVWMTEKSETGADVVVDGIGTGTDTPIQITIGVKPAPNQPDIALITPKSIKAGDSEASTEGETTDILYVFFAAYSEDVKDFAAIRDGIEKANRKFELTETYTNEKEGISFRYPSELEYNEGGEYGTEDEEGTSMVAIFGTYTLSAMGDPSFDMKIQKLTDRELMDKAFADEPEFLDTFGYDSDVFTDIKIGTDELDGVEARTVQAQSAVEGLPSVVLHEYYYVSGPSVYRVILSCSEEALDVYAELFRQIMDSYTITEPEPSPTPVPTPSPTPVPTVSPQYATMEDFLVDPEVDAKLQEMFDQVDGISTTLSISYTEEVLFFEYQYTESGAFGVPEDLLANAAKEKVEAMRSTYEELADKLCEIADIDNPMVIVQYLTPYDDELFYIEFPGE